MIRKSNRITTLLLNSKKELSNHAYAIRLIALGRNNFPFAGSIDVSQSAAIINSQLATCKLHEG